jgi:hypothetical protein
MDELLGQVFEPFALVQASNHGGYRWLAWRHSPAALRESAPHPERTGGYNITDDTGGDLLIGLGAAHKPISTFIDGQPFATGQLLNLVELTGEFTVDCYELAG